MSQNAILLGRINRFQNKMNILVSHESRVSHVDSSDIEILTRMDGFHSNASIARELGCSLDRVEEVFRKHEAPDNLTTVGKWNKLRWCPTCQVYLNSTRLHDCPVCSSKIRYVPLSPPCDPWFCVGEERKFVSDLFADKLGFDLPTSTLLIGNNGIFKGRFFWEIFINGRLQLRIDFTSTDKHDWHYDFSDDLISPEEVSGLPEETLADTIDKNLSAGNEILNDLVRDTSAFLIHVYENVLEKQKPLVYFSGGKESMVMADLFAINGIPCDLLFCGTGLDFPDDVEFIRSLDNHNIPWEAHTLHVIEGDVRKAILLAKSKGRLSPDDLWCRSELKYPIRDAAVQRLYGERSYIACEGSRWYENDFRRQHPRINVLSNVRGYRNGKQKWIHPLAEWNGFDIWSYMFSKALKVNPLYYQGFQRTTCWICPFVNPFHYLESRKRCSDLWEQLGDFQLGHLGQTDVEKKLPF